MLAESRRWNEEIWVYLKAFSKIKGLVPLEGLRTNNKPATLPTIEAKIKVADNTPVGVVDVN